MGLDIIINLACITYYELTMFCFVLFCLTVSGVARAFRGGRVAHPEDQNEEENEENLRKNERNYGKMRKY